MSAIANTLEEVYPRLRTFVGHSPDPDDAAQEAALQLLVRLRRGHVDDLAPYAYVTARNVVYDQRRARARLRAEFAGEPVDRTAASDDPERAVLVGAQVAAVRCALARLPERHRQALTLYDVEERSHREVADALGIREAAARQLVRRARRGLREQLLLEARSSIHGDAPEVRRLREALAQEAGRSYRGALPWLGGLWKAVRELATGEAVSGAAGPAAAKLAAVGAVAVAAATPIALTATPGRGGATSAQAHASTESTRIASRAPGQAWHGPSTSPPHPGPAHPALATQVSPPLPRGPLSPNRVFIPAPTAAGTPLATIKLDASTLTAPFESTDEPQATAEPEHTATPAEQLTTAKPATTKPETGKPQTGKPETGKPETGKPETGKPESTKPESTKVETGNTDSGNTDSDKPGSGKPQGGKPETGTRAS